MRTAIAFAVGAFAMGATAARADHHEEPPPATESEVLPTTDSEVPAAVTHTPSTSETEAPHLTLPKGGVLIDAFVEIGLFSGAAFKPVSLSPDVWYGVTDEVTVGLVHSSVGTTGFVGGVGDSLCITGSSNGCSDFYRNVAVDARYRLVSGSWSWAAEGGLAARSLSPFQLALKLGAVGRWYRDKFAVELEPKLFIGMTNRDGVAAGAIVAGSNQDFLALPASAMYSVSSSIAVGAQTGLLLPFQNTGDAYAIPLSLGAHYRASAPLSFMVALSFPVLIGGSRISGLDIRSLTVGGSYAL